MITVIGVPGVPVRKSDRPSSNISNARKSVSSNSGFLLRFVKGGNKFVIAGGRHLVNVSKEMMGASWPREEWKPNMAELEVSVVFDNRKCSNQEQFLYRPCNFQRDIIC